MLYLIQNHHRNNFKKTIVEMHRKRYEVFYIDLGWDVPVQDGLEIDQYDIDSAIYIISKDADHGVVGSVRLLPTTGPNMIKDTFPHLVSNKSLIPNDPKVWEATRLFYKNPNQKNDKLGLARKGTIELFIAMLEFGVTLGLTGIIVLTDLRIERMLRNIGWYLKQIGEPVEFNKKKYVVGILPVSKEILKKVRKNTSMGATILMFPFPLCIDSTEKCDFRFTSIEDLL